MSDHCPNCHGPIGRDGYYHPPEEPTRVERRPSIRVGRSADWLANAFVWIDDKAREARAFNKQADLLDLARRYVRGER